MPYYLVKADKTHNIQVGDEYARTIGSTINNFFVMDYLIEGMPHYHVDLPNDIWEDFTYSLWKPGKKLKRGFDPFNGQVTLEERGEGLPVTYISYSAEQLQKRMKVRKFLANVFIDDAVRQGIIQEGEALSMNMEMDQINDDDSMNLFYTRLDFDN